MRYRIGETPNELGEPMGYGVTAMAAVFSLLLGIGFVIAGLRSRHYWMSIWGTGLSLCSGVYLVYASLFL